MQSITQQQQLDGLLAEHSAVLVLYGGANCGVCQALKPQLLHLLTEQLPRVKAVYVDCQQGGASLCAQERIMALPVVHIWFEGRRFAEFFKVFSLAHVSAALTRPYQLLFEND
ncbi:thioredoxin family protein [Oceanisphaera pacifica]|uniref:Thioredoxin family protein n=1 Tax=Oceanisphaera pacifica TaxID=2818389 RepID=A0ABS3NHK9_9GAMM|nr:thioredoxin family protein [Oceanisphaera pacifica]MBO1520056.1 thioredoxin family protein [Oceanisphaera pacifica]